MLSHQLGSAKLAVSTLCAATFSNDECGANGLPLTPNSIRILGRFQKLKTLSHDHLCRYLDLQRDSHGWFIDFMMFKNVSCNFGRNEVD